MTPLRVKQAMDASGSNVDITDLFPENPRPGDLWWDSENGTLRIYYEDGDSGQ